MLQFVCHPVLQNLLTTSKEGMNGITSKNNAVLISDFLPTTSPSIHAGLLEVVKYRLFNPSEFIFFASFFPKEQLLPLDTFEILTLTGTEFIRLPLQSDHLLLLIEEKQRTETNLSKSDWETFAIQALKTLLKEKLSVLKHGGKFDFVNNVTFALRIEAQNCLENPLRIIELKKLLVSVTSYGQNKEISELIAMSGLCDGLTDQFLQNVSEFTKRFIQLESYESQQQIDFHLLISDIDKLNTVSSNIINQ